jgi:hypothetical protein
MTCTHVTLPGGTRAIVCSSVTERPCSGCGRRADLLCDWKVPSRKSGTCDKPICKDCATSPAPDKDICPAHAPDLKAWLAARPGYQQTEGPSQTCDLTRPETLMEGAPMHDLLTPRPGGNLRGK